LLGAGAIPSAAHAWGGIFNLPPDPECKLLVDRRGPPGGGGGPDAGIEQAHRRAALNISIALPEPGASECRAIFYSILAEIETAGEIENHVIHMSITPEQDRIQCLFRFESGADGALFERRLRNLLRRYKLSSSAMKVN
jgi:hypothetical protein